MKTKIKIGLILLFSFLLTGCWNYHELNDLEIATTLTISREGNDYLIHALIIDPSQTENNVFKGAASTVLGALEDIQSQLPKKLYLNHLSTVIVSKECAETGLSSILDSFLRNPKINKNFYLLITEEKMDDLLNHVSPQYQANAYQLPINSSKENGIPETATFNNIISRILEPGIDPIIPILTLHENTIQLSGSYLFHDDKMSGTVTKEESEQISFLNSSKNTLLLVDNIDSCKILYRLTRDKIKYEIKNKKIEISLHLSSSIWEVQCNKKQTFSEKDLKIHLEKNITTRLQKTIDITKNNQSDVLGYGNKIYKNEYQSWPITLSDLTISLESHVTIKQQDNLKKAFGGGLK